MLHKKWQPVFRLSERQIPSRPAVTEPRKPVGYMTASLKRYIRSITLAFSGASINENTLDKIAETFIILHHFGAINFWSRKISRPWGNLLLVRRK